MSTENQNESKPYNPAEIEKEIYQIWEKSGYFAPENLPAEKNGKAFCVIMPPPNANGAMHTGHAVFVTLEDIMTRYHRMRGDQTLWLPGADHAGFETQVVFEKKLEKEGRNRFEIPREQLYKETLEFTLKNKKTMEDQLRSLGASCDWSREKFTLDPDIIKIVYQTFKKLYDDELAYRAMRPVNWCTKHQTGLSDLEVKYEERKDKLWYFKYPIVKENSPQPSLKGGSPPLLGGVRGDFEYITVATTRPETMLGDTAVAVNPKDKRYKNLVGKKVKLPLTGREIPIIADAAVEVDFGTGAVKVTPAHDPVDFEISQRHKLDVIEVIGKDGKMTKETPQVYQGLKVEEARAKVVAELTSQNFLEKDEPYKHSVSVCYKCGRPIEPVLMKQWFVKIKPLAEKAIAAVKKGEVKFVTKKYEKIFMHWMKNIRDWNISRQIVWGIRIPAWYKNGQVYVGDEPPKEKGWTQDSDVFDTWFSSGQWPFATLRASQPDDFNRFYPTSVMETGWDILFFWVARMIMLGIYCAGDVPFKHVYLHGLVRDKDRIKMSKSKGNAIDPLAVVQDHGADALRMSLVFGTSAGNDIVVSEDKVIAQKRFVNKIWNASKFVIMNLEPGFDPANIKKPKYTKDDKWILKELTKTTKRVTQDIEKFRFHEAAQEAYQFFWHSFCDKTIENVKIRIQQKSPDANAGKLVLWTVLYNSLKLLHPFVPFVTEAIYQKLPARPKELLMIEDWPNF
ncbi:MAG: valine--tRNA ligase [bacterium]